MAPRQLEAGDHIYCQRMKLIYDHHGIYVGNDMVIHLRGKRKKFKESSSCNKCGYKRFINGEIAKVCIDCFLEGETVQIYDYGVPSIDFFFRQNGTCSCLPSKPPHEVITTAIYFLEKGYDNYDMIFNNCEDFAVYCKTGTSAAGTQATGRIINGVAAAALVPGAAPYAAPIVGIYFVRKEIKAIKRQR
ncbi:uncharacterized protein LOC120183993 [Hibiscus syriacus]|uniref:uncharacterized protein LOC120183993 n=1 Tax=Hibiscus syriacus TaxID=106335 RepID=UPI001922824B|nr:uncharacterized protein LOC120183993 [Hibiscus syriacus]